MRAGLFVAAAFLTLVACHPRQPHQPLVNEGPISAEPVSLTAKDGVKVAGVYTRAANPKALILLFHQAGSGKDEYALIAPRLAESGYSSLRIDQRAGGELFGVNETVKALGKSDDYLAAKPDLEAAFDWARAQKLPIILWGSSYSSSLVFVLAAEHPVKAVLAFSPGEYFDDKQMIAKAAAGVKAPVFVTSAQDGEEIDAARDILKAVPVAGKEQFVPKLGGVHGSSTLLRTKNPGGAEDAWKAVLAFLAGVTKG
ncbi:alpha/beta hydrolase [Sphingomonas sp. JC676]|uniref:serine aminopeptidase domain-containing protein n=1 Tax=Sphingomonas sp. JC676 TaxID=2768065 RepID=UPI001657A1BD|nr:alpha/beta hydrolase [Sphingomonas sp. JC676]MBC9033648.1 alpha/beta hydrolase [Sphingomonas sp. JC676]